MMIEQLSALQGLEAAGKAASRKKEDPALREVCKEMEGIFVSILLKQGMKSASMSDEKKPAGSEQMQDYAIEQAAREMGKQGAFGIGEMLYDELTKLL